MKQIKTPYFILLLILAILGIYALFNKPDNSSLFIYRKVPDFEFIDQHSDTITNKDYKGKVYVVEFFFTTCPTICPLMNQAMSQVQEAFLKEPNFGIASISITPNIDTPQVLKEYAMVFKAQHTNWHFLTGKPADYVYKLSNNGFKLRAGKSGGEEHSGFEHSGLFALIDKQGRIRSRYDENGDPILYYRGIDEDENPQQLKELIEDIKILLKEK